ncbi:hypothetical protein NDK47_01145 [Brevibacillus ruminantium]|uniref:Uncharacterized protein n=1 Tax=Brevibacillus ruminantium TaxID=2950604 RepID=A0ABY4WIL1_9BACL|nr:hypothetical protein [Brevibacillus ruminantium]USG65993.1 hypothetical protein NDK47_01145 [Brevibacillus ruminantium]
MGIVEEKVFTVDSSADPTSSTLPYTEKVDEHNIEKEDAKHEKQEILSF